MFIFKLLLLFGFVCTTFAAHIGHHEDHVFHDEDHTEVDDDEDEVEEESELIPARANYGSRRTVLWTGPNSYNGYRKPTPQIQPKPTYNRQSIYYPRQNQYVSRGTQYQPSRQPSRTVKVPLYNKQRANDQKYKEGLQDLAGLM